ncbi:hypothetical protein D3874_24205 [Oleomonas cavernae]|uniref:O-acyltransferase WSD1-like N-terminal domain-containing protein n=1 Tax=Oleomonas cavernae TaxID=2320859 RepID=A0A418WI75_9PROT|nr:hypothetical protein D3874_24205 [Oleomonas cavernae]
MVPGCDALLGLEIPAEPGELHGNADECFRRRLDGGREDGIARAFRPAADPDTPSGGPPGFVRDLVEAWRQYRHFAPPFNLTLGGLVPPRWQAVPDADIDLDYHFRHSALPAPGGERELGILVSRLHSNPLDQRRPLWECHVIEGLDGGRFAIYLKLHHAQLDGMGTARLFDQVMARDPALRDMPPPWAIGMKAGRPSPKPGSRRPGILARAQGLAGPCPASPGPRPRWCAPPCGQMTRIRRPPTGRRAAC